MLPVRQRQNRHFSASTVTNMTAILIHDRHHDCAGRAHHRRAGAVPRTQVHVEVTIVYLARFTHGDFRRTITDADGNTISTIRKIRSELQIDSNTDVDIPLQSARQNTRTAPTLAEWTERTEDDAECTGTRWAPRPRRSAFGSFLTSSSNRLEMASTFFFFSDLPGRAGGLRRALIHNSALPSAFRQFTQKCLRRCACVRSCKLAPLQ